MKTMTVVASSTFHPLISQTFRVPAECGRYPCRVLNPCDGVHDSCVCGWPVGRTTWESPEGYVVHAEWADNWDNLGRNNIVIVVEPCWSL